MLSLYLEAAEWETRRSIEFLSFSPPLPSAVMGGRSGGPRLRLRKLRGLREDDVSPSPERVLFNAARFPKELAGQDPPGAN